MQALRLLQTVGDTVTLLVAKGPPGNDKLSIVLDKDNGALGFRYTKQQCTHTHACTLSHAHTHPLTHTHTYTHHSIILFVQSDHTVVTVVTPNSQAAKAGIKQGDILLEVSILHIYSAVCVSRYTVK